MWFYEGKITARRSHIWAFFLSFPVQHEGLQSGISLLSTFERPWKNLDDNELGRGSSKVDSNTSGYAPPP
jgi:hypothetical protein